MPIRFQCWQCQKALSIGTRKAGTRIQCPVCNATQTVPCAPGTVLHPAAADSGEFPTPLNGPEEDFPVAAPAPRIPVAEAVPTCSSPPFQEPATAAPDRPRLPSFLAGSLVLALAVMLGVACWAFISSAVKLDNKRRLPPGPAERAAGQPSGQAQAANKPMPPSVDPDKPEPAEKPAPPPNSAKQPPDAEVKPPPPPPAMEKQPPKKAPEAPPQEVKPKPPAPEVQPKPPEKATAPEVAREKEAESPRKLKETPGQGKESAPPAAKPAVAAPKPLLVLRYRPRTFPVYVAETDTRSLEAAARKYGLLYSCTIAEPTPVSGLQWYAYQFQYRWYEKSLDSPEQLAAMEAELAGLWERFGFRVEVSRE